MHACPGCGLEFLDPQPGDAILERIYGDEYFLGGTDRASAEKRAKIKNATGALYIDQLAALVKPEGARLLEIGCGQGEALLEARRRGFCVSGIEMSCQAAAGANRLLGGEVVSSGSLEKLALPPEQFSAVLAADVIEHVRDPKSCLLRIYETLAPGGALLLITPSLDSWSRRMLGYRWMEYKIEHLHYFSTAALRLLLERCGFVEISITSNYKVLTIDYLTRHFERFPVPVLSGLLRVFRRLLPSRIAHHHLLVPASGLRATARRPAAPGSR